MDPQHPDLVPVMKDCHRLSKLSLILLVVLSCVQGLAI